MPANRRSAIYDQKALDGPTVEVLPATRERGGYKPEQLDATIKTMVHNAQQGAELLRTNAPLMHELLQQMATEVQTLLDAVVAARELRAQAAVDGTVPEARSIDDLARDVDLFFKLAGRATVMMERVTKMILASGKALDEATRLRVFLAGGEEDPDGLDKLSESELRRIVVEAASGWVKPEVLP